MSFENYMFKKLIPNNKPIKVLIMDIDCNDAIFSKASTIEYKMSSFMEMHKMNENDSLYKLYNNAAMKRADYYHNIWRLEEEYQLFLKSFDPIDISNITEINTNTPSFNFTISYLTKLSKSKESFFIYFDILKMKDTILAFDDFCDEFNILYSRMRKEPDMVSDHEKDDMEEVYKMVNEFHETTYEILKSEAKELYISSNHLHLLLQNYRNEMKQYDEYWDEE